MMIRGVDVKRRGVGVGFRVGYVEIRLHIHTIHRIHRQTRAENTTKKRFCSD